MALTIMALIIVNLVIMDSNSLFVVILAIIVYKKLCLLNNILICFTLLYLFVAVLIINLLILIKVKFSKILTILISANLLKLTIPLNLFLFKLVLFQKSF